MPRWPLVALLSALACSPAGTRPGRPAAAYAGRSAELFDDSIEGRAVGLDPEAASSFRTDATFRERVQVADATVRVSISTLTVKQEDAGPSYQVGFRVVDKLAGAGVLPPTFTVLVARTSPSAGILRSYESQLVGKRFIAFVRLFASQGQDGEPAYHFHLAADSKEVEAAVKEATVLDSFRN
jgi:hypothetical protein